MIVFGGLKNINAHCLPKKTALMGGPINSSAWKASNEIFEYIFFAWESKIISLSLFAKTQLPLNFVNARRKNKV